MSNNVIQNQQTWQWFAMEGSSSFPEQRGRDKKGWTCLRPPRRAMAQSVMVSALSSVLPLYGWPALILPYWSGSSFLECPDSCLRHCPIGITEHFSASDILLLHGPFTSHLPSEGCFLPGLIICFKLHSKGGHFYGTEQKFHSIDLANIVKQLINKGSDPVFSLLALHVIYPETYNKIWTWANIWSPLERQSPNLVTFSVQACSSPCLCSGRCRNWSQGTISEGIQSWHLMWTPSKVRKWE